MSKYKINKIGEKYIFSPDRNNQGLIPTTYYKNLIVMYLLAVGKYLPSEFKYYIQAIDVLNQEDFEYQRSRKYPKWQHYIDAAKQQLLKKEFIFENEDGSFSLSDEDKALDIVSKFMNVSIEQKIVNEFDITCDKNIIEKYKTMVTRYIRDTILTKKNKIRSW